jgi:hypothetical protein
MHLAFQRRNWAARHHRFSVFIIIKFRVLVLLQVNAEVVKHLPKLML